MYFFLCCKNSIDLVKVFHAKADGISDLIVLGNVKALLQLRYMAEVTG